MFSRSFARYQEVMGQFGCKQKILRCNDVMVVYFSWQGDITMYEEYY